MLESLSSLMASESITFQRASLPYNNGLRWIAGMLLTPKLWYYALKHAWLSKALERCKHLSKVIKTLRDCTVMSDNGTVCLHGCI